MSVIASLDVFLRGNTQNLDAALDKSGKKVKDLKEQASKPAGVGALGGSLTGALGTLANGLPGGSNLAGMFTGMTGGAKGATSALGMVAGGLAGLAASAIGAGVALAAFGIHQMGAIGSTARMAQTLGLSMGSLQALEHQANMSGISAEELHHNLMKMEEGIGDASSKASKALAELGINQAAFKNKGTLEQFEEIEAKMRSITNQGDKLRLAKELWGKSGALMAGMFDKDAKTAKEAREEAEKLGLVLSKDEASQVREANKAWKVMQSAITGIGNALAVELAPMIKTIAAGIKDMVIGLREFMGELTVDTPMWMRVLISIPSVMQLGMTSIMFAFTKLAELIIGLLAKLPGLGELKEGAEAIGKTAEAQFIAMAEYAKEIEDILHPKKKPVVPGKPKDPEPDKGASKVEGSDKNKAALAGSTEAFSIIAGNDGDKMYRATNNILNENKKMAKLLEKMAQKFNGVKLVKKKL
jgi:hypothetical protein